MGDREQQKKPNWLSIAIALLLISPRLVIPIAIFAGIVYLAIRSVKKQQNGTQPAKTAYPRKSSSLDDCPKKLFCFHKDKGEHHVARGKEIDPWDRPDIDISKYQRKG